MDYTTTAYGEKESRMKFVCFTIKLALFRKSHWNNTPEKYVGHCWSSLSLYFERKKNKEKRYSTDATKRGETGYLPIVLIGKWQLSCYTTCWSASSFCPLWFEVCREIL